MEGICTRQLPDAVVCLFFPNEQNLAGLRRVVADIRSEAAGPRHKKIQLHFVMSNVPDLDDEEQILNNRMDVFSEGLGYEELTATIHRYESLALLNQVIFTQARPKSRLTREYLVLKDAIVGENVEDREGAVRFLKESSRPGGFEFHLGKEEVESRLEKILQLHPHDGEILFLIAMVRKVEQRSDDALALLDQVIANGYGGGEPLLERAEIHQKSSASVAVADISRALALPTLGVDNVEKAIRMLRKLAPAKIAEIPTSAAANALNASDLISVADSLQWSREELAVAYTLVAPLVENPRLDDAIRREAQGALILSLVALARFNEASESAESIHSSLDSMTLMWSFNYAMAQWGLYRPDFRKSFARVIQKQQEGEIRRGGARTNYLQCLAVAFWAVGEATLATDVLNIAEDMMQQYNRACFSCWRYSIAKPKEFLHDCQEIRRLIRGEDVRPSFFPLQAK